MPYNIRIKDISFTYDKKELFRNVSISISNGQIIVLTGRSGCGKSTMLEICAGLIAPHEGFVYWDGKNILNLSINEMTLSLIHI